MRLFLISDIKSIVPITDWAGWDCLYASLSS